MACEEFEVAIEKRRHGALEEPERAVLERHLSGCASCRAFDETVRRTEGAMASITESAVGAVDWTKVERGIRAGLSRVVFGFVALLLAAGISAALAAWAAPARAAHRAITVLLALAPVALLYGAVALVAARRLVRLDRGGEMLRTYERMLRGRVRVLAVLRFAAAGVAAVAIWSALDLAAGDRARVVLGIEAAVLIGVTAWVQLYRLPRLRRELSELDGGSR